MYFTFKLFTVRGWCNNNHHHHHHHHRHRFLIPISIRPKCVLLFIYIVNKPHIRLRSETRSVWVKAEHENSGCWKHPSVYFKHEHCSSVHRFIFALLFVFFFLNIFFFSTECFNFFFFLILLLLLQKASNTIIRFNYIGQAKYSMHEKKRFGQSTRIK